MSFNASLGDQLLAILLPRADSVDRIVAPPAVEEIGSMMKEQSLTGRAFANDRYDNTYVESYQKTRRRLNVIPVDTPVTMRATKQRIEQTRVEYSKGVGATIVFQDSDMGKVFKYHHDGINYSRVGLRMRSLYPKELGSVPPDFRDDVYASTLEVLRGKK